jgi:hypothetical protein
MWQFFLLYHVTIIMNDGDHISKKKLMSKNHHNATCQILIDG